MSYNDDSATRQQQIASDLDTYYKTSSALFTDRDTFDKAFNFTLRDETQKATMDKRWGINQNKLLYANRSATDIAGEIKNGTTSLDNFSWMESSNPEKYAEIQAGINKNNQDIIAVNTVDAITVTEG